MLESKGERVKEGIRKKKERERESKRGRNRGRERDRKVFLVNYESFEFCNFSITCPVTIVG